MEEETTSGLCMYVVTTGERQREISRLFASVAASSYIPQRILLLTHNSDVLDNAGLRIHIAILDRMFNCMTDIIVLDPDQFSGLCAQKNVALHIMEQSRYAYGLSVDDDMVFEPYCIERLVSGLNNTPDFFAMGPMIRNEGDRAFKTDDRLMQFEIADVVDGVWQWHGFRQGARLTEEYDMWPVEHLAGCYMHRCLPGKRYDTQFDRRPYFLHESDFVYDKHNGVLTKAKVYHWPGTSDSLTNQRGRHKHHMFQNIQYFARKYGIGEVDSVDWSSFAELEDV